MPRTFGGLKDGEYKRVMENLWVQLKLILMRGYAVMKGLDQSDAIIMRIIYNTVVFSEPRSQNRQTRVQLLPFANADVIEHS